MKNSYVIISDTVEITCIRRSGEAIKFVIDLEDFEKVRNYTWRINNGYSVTNVYKNNKKTHLRLHRLLMNNPKSFVDHIDGNPLNNRKSNLRPATYSENNRNQKIRKDNSTGVKGLYVQNSSGYLYWHAHIWIEVNGIRKQVHKIFPYTESGKFEATQWLHDMREVHHGEFARHD